MLTADLVNARVYKKEVRPRYIKPRSSELLELATQLIETFEAHQGERRETLEAELTEILGDDTDFMLHRALAKLLFDRCEFEAASPVPPEELRASVFAAAAQRYRAGDGAFDRATVLAEAANSLGAEVEAVEEGLYADLKSEQRLTRWRSCAPDWLLKRYNVALAQGVLLRASRLEIELGPATPQEHRALFRKVKFFRLMHRVRRGEDGGWRLILDGPLSLFKASGKYGVAMASFLPTLMCFEDWRLEADVAWGVKRRPCTFKLAAEDKLRSHVRLDGQWQPAEIAAFAGRFSELESDWRIDADGELIDLGGEGVLVTDFVFEHASAGLRVAMEIFGFWRRGALDSRLELLRKHGPRHMIVAVSSLLGADRGKLGELPAEVYKFRTQPVPSKVKKILDSFLE